MQSRSRIESIAAFHTTSGAASSESLESRRKRRHVGTIIFADLQLLYLDLVREPVTAPVTVDVSWTDAPAYCRHWVGLDVRQFGGKSFEAYTEFDYATV